MKNLKIFGLLLFGIMFLASCEYELIEFEEPVINEEVSFADDIIPIFSNSCVSCHGEGHWKVDLTPENAYVDLFAKGLINKDMPAESILYVVLTEPGGFHDGKTTPTEQFLILTWIEEGANDN